MTLLSRSVTALGVAASLTIGVVGGFDAPADALTSDDLPGETIVYPTPIDDVLSNPGMGWVYIDNAIPGAEDNGRFGTLPDFTNVAVLSDWSQLEPSPGVYDWSRVDSAIAYWAGQGKRLHFRIATDNMMINPLRYVGGTPQWLYEAPYGVGFTWKCNDEAFTQPDCLDAQGNQTIRYHVPDYESPTYLDRLASFLSAFGEKYNNDARIDTIDVRGYGQWGEWHSGGDFSSLSTRAQTLRSIIDLWADAFPDKVLNISNSYEYRSSQSPSVNAPASYEDYRAWSGLDHALAKSNVTYRRDGIAGCLREFDRRGLEEAWNDADLLPITLEFCGGYPIESWSSMRYRMSEVLGLHPNYITTMGWSGDEGAADFHDETAVVREGNLKMGYRLVIDRASFPDAVTAGGKMTIRSQWSNLAVGRAPKPYEVRYHLVDASGDEAWSGMASDIDLRRVTAGRSAGSVSTFDLPTDLPSGTYQVRVGVRDVDLDLPIKLAIADVGADGTYPLGDVVVGGSAGDGSEGFESGSFADTEFSPAEAGTLTDDPGLAVSGAWSVHASRPSSTPWAEILNSDSARLRLRPNTAYAVQFSARTVAASGADGGLYVLARSAGGGFDRDRGFTLFADPVGTTSEHRIVVTTGERDDYYLIWGLKNGGSVSLDDISIREVGQESFESMDLSGTSFSGAQGGSITTSSSEVINGSASLRGTADANQEWTEILNSVPSGLPLMPRTAYTVEFTAKSISPSAAGGGLYALARTSSGGFAFDTGLSTWSGDGVDGRHRFDFVTGDQSDVYVIWGLKNGGAVSLDDIRIRPAAELSAGQIARLGFDEGQDSTASGFGVDSAVFSGEATWASGARHTSAVALDGGVVTLPTSAALNNVQNDSYTLSAAYRPTVLPSGTGGDNSASHALLVKTGWHTGLSLGSDGHYRATHALADGSVAEVRSVAAFPANEWHTVTVTVDRQAGLIVLYVDGLWQNSGTFVPDAATRDYGTAPWLVGNANPGATQWGWPAEGAIDDVGIWNRALSAAEAQFLARQVEDFADTTPPILSGVPDDGTALPSTTTLNLAISATDEESAVRDLEVVFDGRTVPSVGEIDLVGLEGARTLSVRATNESGLVADQETTILVYVDEGSSDPPGVPALSTTSGWRTGSHDGTYDVRMNLWWGVNGSVFRLFENGRLISSQVLSAQSPAGQTATVAISGRGNGTYVYTGELENARGKTATSPVTVEVTDAAPAVPVVSHDNWDEDGAYTLTTNLWWGTNATQYTLYENDVAIERHALTAASPAAQRVASVIAGRDPGTYDYVVELSNDAGVTRSTVLSVIVR